MSAIYATVNISSSPTTLGALLVVQGNPKLRKSTGVFQNENTDADEFVIFGDDTALLALADEVGTPGNLANWGVKIPRATGVNAPTTLTLGSVEHAKALTENLYLFNNGSGSKNVRINLL